MRNDSKRINEIDLAPFRIKEKFGTLRFKPKAEGNKFKAIAVNLERLLVKPYNEWGNNIRLAT